jgi:hypothetical protein
MEKPEALRVGSLVLTGVGVETLIQGIKITGIFSKGPANSK